MGQTEERYERQQALDLIVPEKAFVVGCGGIGSWAALLLAQAGVRELHVFDRDQVEVHNLNRLPLGRQHLGMVKSEAICQVINDGRGDFPATPHGHFDPRLHAEIVEQSSWCLVSTDTLKSRREVYEFCKTHGIKYVEMSADGVCGSVFFEPADFQTDLEDNPGYASVPVFVGPCVIAASVAIYYVLKNKRPEELVFNFGWGNRGGPFGNEFYFEKKEA